MQSIYAALFLASMLLAGVWTPAECVSGGIEQARTVTAAHLLQNSQRALICEADSSGISYSQKAGAKFKPVFYCGNAEAVSFACLNFYSGRSIAAPNFRLALHSEFEFSEVVMTL